LEPNRSRQTLVSNETILLITFIIEIANIIGLAEWVTTLEESSRIILCNQEASKFLAGNLRFICFQHL